VHDVGPKLPAESLVKLTLPDGCVVPVTVAVQVTDPPTRTEAGAQDMASVGGGVAHMA
jgi:hypothetical protein